MIAEWTTDTNALFNQVTEWSSHNNWTVQPEITYKNLPRNDENLEIHGLKIITQEGRIHFEPLGRRADGKVIVELYAWPTLVRVRLERDPNSGTWQVVTDTGIPFYWEWNEITFTRLIHDLQVLP